MRRFTRYALPALFALAITTHGANASAEEDPEADRWRAFMPVFAPGAIAFLAGYVPLFAAATPAALRVPTSVAGGRDSGDIGGLALAIPFAGPFLFADGHPRDAAINPHGAVMSPPMQTLLYADGLAQVGGAALMLIGVAAGHRQSDEHVSQSATFSFSPLLAPGSYGVGARITGW